MAKPVEEAETGSAEQAEAVVLPQQLPPEATGKGRSPQLIVIRNARTGDVICRIEAHCGPSRLDTPTPYAADHSCLERYCLSPVKQSRGLRQLQAPELFPQSSGKTVDEVLEVVRDLTGCQEAVLMDGPDASNAIAYTRSDRVSPGTYFVRLPAAPEGPPPPKAPSWQAQLAAVVLALLTLGLVMQSLIFMLSVPFCGCNWKCIHNSYRMFIGHIDGPFKVFTFMAAIQRAAARPEIWLQGLHRITTIFEKLVMSPHLSPGLKGRGFERQKVE